ncbi:MAG: caspase family protein [Hyphomicrobiaceae bacterium]|nr:caspase family protein [Hyphomicrobiaceae bacterium]
MRRGAMIAAASRTVRRAALMIAAAVALHASLAAAQTAPPIPEPQLRIEAGQHTAVIRRIGLGANELMLATASEDKTVRLWSLPDGRQLRVLRVPIGPGNDGKIYAVALSPDGQTVAVGGWDAAYRFGAANYIYLISTVTGSITRRLGPFAGAINHLAYSYDGSRLAAGIGGGAGIRVWDAGDWRLVGEDKDYADLVFGFGFDRAGRLAASGFDGFVRLYDENMVRLHKVATQGGKKPYGTALSPDGRFVAVGYLDVARVDVLSSNGLKLSHIPLSDGLQGQDLVIVAWSADGRTLFGGGRQYVWTNENRWRTPVLRWADAGRGARQAFPAGPRDLINDMKPWGSNGVAYGTGDPAFGILDGNGRPVLQRGPVTADLSEHRGAEFLASEDLRRVRIRMGGVAGDPWLLDIAEPSLKPMSGPAPDLVPAKEQGLPLTDWKNSLAPKLGGKPLPLEPYETSFSVAVLPAGAGLLMGTHFNLRRYDAAGREVWKRHVPAVAWGIHLSADGRLASVAYGDGTLRWHRTSDGQELLAFFVHVPQDKAAEKRWVMWTPKGYYTSSAAGEDLIGWHVNRGWNDAPDFFPAAQFRNQFNRPDIIRLVLDTLDEEKAIQQANAASRRVREVEDIRKRQPPVVMLTSHRDGERFQTSKVAIGYSVRSPSGLPVRRVWALIDGREAETTKGFVPVAPGAPGETKGSLTLDLPERDVRVAVIAETDQGTASVPAEIQLRWGGAPAAVAPPSSRTTGPGRALPRLYALAIGVASYKDKSIPALEFAAKDARDVAEALKAQKGRLYEDVEVRLLTDNGATSSEIRKGLGWIATKPAQSDVAILFLSGHGVTDETGDYQFLPFDTEMDASAPIWLPVEGTALPHSDFTRALKRAQRAHTFFLFDTCHAGDATGARRKGRPSYTKFVNELASAETGVRVLASSEGREVSLEDARWQNGAFTKALVEGLSGAADLYQPTDGVVTADELALFVKRRVQELTRDRQHPVTQFPGMVRDIPLAALR